MTTDATIRLRLNGEIASAAEGTRLLELLAARGIDAARVAVERNGEVIPRRLHPEVVVADGDVFEVVQFVGGG